MCNRTVGMSLELSSDAYMSLELSSDAYKRQNQNVFALHQTM